MKNRIAEWRTARGLTQEQLADLVGAHFTTINRIENGKQGLSQKWIEKLSKVLEVNAFDLMSESIVQDTSNRNDFKEEAILYQPARGHWLSGMKLGENHALYKINSKALSAAGIDAGTIVLANLSADAIADALNGTGTTPVLAQFHYDDHEFMNCVTLPRLFVPPHTLIRNSLDKEPSPLVLGNERTNVIATIQSIVRDVMTEKRASYV